MDSAHNLAKDALYALWEQTAATTQAFMIFAYKLFSTVSLASVLCNGVQPASNGAATNLVVKPYSGKPLQDIVTWDEHSIFVRGERIMLFSGEFHPFRLPVPDFWLDVFQKLRSAGFSAVSFYTHWVLPAWHVE